MSIFTDPEAHKSLGHPLATGSLQNNVKLLWKNRGFSPRYSLRMANILSSNVALLPFRWYEKLKWDSKVEKVHIQEPPLFILGHWRCGTTYLHNLLSQDNRFGYISTLQAFCPEICIETKLLLPIFKKLLPQRRPMDNMRMSVEFPQEEEYALANLSLLSFYHGYFFPQIMRANFNFLLFQDVSDEIINHWKEVYIRILKKATLIHGGKPLIIKNPMNMVRIPLLLELFPGAKFVHIYRNPYIVFYSTVFTFKTMISAYGLRKMNTREVEENVLHIYDRMMERFWKTKDLIPPGNFTEIKFEELETDPLTVLERVYRELSLPDFTGVKSALERYILAQADYQKNTYPLNKHTNQRIYSRWGWIIDRFGYSIPENLEFSS